MDFKIILNGFLMDIKTFTLNILCVKNIHDVIFTY
jgi:hypothetical protein